MAETQEYDLYECQRCSGQGPLERDQVFDHLARVHQLAPRGLACQRHSLADSAGEDWYGGTIQMVFDGGLVLLNKWRRLRASDLDPRAGDLAQAAGEALDRLAAACVARNLYLSDPSPRGQEILDEAVADLLEAGDAYQLAAAVYFSRDD